MTSTPRAAENDTHLRDVAAAICATDACPVDHGQGMYCFRGFDAARAIPRVEKEGDPSTRPVADDALYRALLGLILEHCHVAVSNEQIVVEDVAFDAPAPIRGALVHLMEEWVDGEATAPMPPAGTIHTPETNPSGPLPFAAPLPAR